MATPPKLIRNFNVFVNGTNFAGLCKEVTLPSFKPVTDEHRAGGMDSSILIDLGMERMELKFMMAEHNAQVFRQVGLLNGNDVQLLFRAAQVGSGAVIPYYITVRGMYSDVTPESVKAGEASGLEATISVRYLKLELNGESLIEIDVDNFKRIIDGVDQLAGVRDVIDA